MTVLLVKVRVSVSGTMMNDEIRTEPIVLVTNVGVSHKGNNDLVLPTGSNR